MSIFGFMQLSFADIVDIFLVAALLFCIFKSIRGSSLMGVFVLILALLIFREAASALEMKLTSALLGALFDVGIVALIVIYQPEIRHFLIRFGNNSRFSGQLSKTVRRFFGEHDNTIGHDAINEIAEACRIMSKEKTGALIVFPHRNSVQHIIDTGDIINASLSSRLIRNIFFKNSPLHDGAMVITGDLITAARCTLPITQRTDIPPHFGMRHKAAIGLTEECDADVVTVSEETGDISFCHKGEIIPVENINRLKLLLKGEQYAEEGAE